MIVQGSSIVREVWMQVARETIDKLVRPLGYDYETLVSMSTGIAVVGSQAALCARPGSDWDVLVQLPPAEHGFTKKYPGIDLMFEDPTHENWLWRELPNHAAGYSIWLHGQQAWKNEDLDWERCAAFVARRVERSVRAVTSGRFHGSLLKKYAARAVSDSQRLQHLHRREYIPPTSMLTKQFDGRLLKPCLDVLKDIGVLNDLELI